MRVLAATSAASTSSEASARCVSVCIRVCRAMYVGTQPSQQYAPALPAAAWMVAASRRSAAASRSLSAARSSLATWRGLAVAFPISPPASAAAAAARRYSAFTCMAAQSTTGGVASSRRTTSSLSPPAAAGGSTAAAAAAASGGGGYGRGMAPMALPASHAADVASPSRSAAKLRLLHSVALMARTRRRSTSAIPPASSASASAAYSVEMPRVYAVRAAACRPPARCALPSSFAARARRHRAMVGSVAGTLSLSLSWASARRAAAAGGGATEAAAAAARGRGGRPMRHVTHPMNASHEGAGAASGRQYMTTCATPPAGRRADAERRADTQSAWVGTSTADAPTTSVTPNSSPGASSSASSAAWSSPPMARPAPSVCREVAATRPSSPRTAKCVSVSAPAGGSGAPAAVTARVSKQVCAYLPRSATVGASGRADHTLSSPLPPTLLPLLPPSAAAASRATMPASGGAVHNDARTAARTASAGDAPDGAPYGTATSPSAAASVASCAPPPLVPSSPAADADVAAIVRWALVAKRQIKQQQKRQFYGPYIQLYLIHYKLVAFAVQMLHTDQTIGAKLVASLRTRILAVDPVVPPRQHGVACNLGSSRTQQHIGHCSGSSRRAPLDDAAVRSLAAVAASASTVASVARVAAAAAVEAAAAAAAAAREAAPAAAAEVATSFSMAGHTSATQVRGAAAMERATRASAAACNPPAADQRAAACRRNCATSLRSSTTCALAGNRNTSRAAARTSARWPAGVTLLFSSNTRRYSRPQPYRLPA